ncbi:MAG TPA: signal peptide peptidase SppA [Kofleriaceae bacterium]|nr:signal peptide peptidase SppA [Kofleriaceae bacterium]
MRQTILCTVAALALASCATKTKPAGRHDAGDPWASASSGSGKAAGAAKPSALGGGDPMEMLKNIAENLKKPGPYEAPVESAGYDAAKPHVGVLTLDGTIGELPTFSWTGGMNDVIPLRKLTRRLRELAADPNLTTLVLRVDEVHASLPDLAELRLAFADLRAKGKHLLCHTEGASNAGYVLLSACERIVLAPTGEISLTGPAAMPIHLKGLLDKLGVTADFLHIGAYKGAAEPLTRDRPSKEMEETLDAILDRAYATMVDTVAAGRGLTADQVKALIDEGIFTSQRAVDARLVDEIATFEEFRDKAAGQVPWGKLKLSDDDDDSPGGAMIKVARFLGAVPTSRPTSPHVALVYAVGDVKDGDGDGTLGARQEIASRTLVAALRVLAHDDSVKAVVLRIDSGGGSALASELIWHAVAEVKAAKPVIVSMSDVAASGGYYIACGATKIFALDDTLTGSIGVVGGKIAPGGALARLGVTTFPRGRGKRATMNASLDPWTDDERAAIQATMESVYDTFVDRVAAGRGKSHADIDAIAQGRVWTGTDAKRLGLVDEIGGLDAALAEAKKQGGLGDDATVEEYPAEITLRDIVHSLGAVQLPFGMGGAVETAARELSPEAADVVEHTLEQLASFRTTHVQAVAILPVVFE